ncbi:MAG: phenylalanine--tRNA ligase subunit beta [Nitrospirae bacterium GWC2_46_6]|nr:MAG: phenylalanine--tRNA ligase subunit beta [Nitrospirae bacterium GWA2_46_11]OGW22419.1 MAG: phenylalanine--tRNA ligase subunit beta [Nitrospirae bacterium GWC2_46_6]OGW24450.1 MAG: phenylalanine--tRNA ligase subunit beta [Nitrospirae bacterium GWB2_47_37]
MRIPLEWLREFVAVPADASEVAHKLTMIGLEVEAVENLDNDVVFEVNVTPNRPDCLSVIGIARELSAVYNTPLEFPDHDILAETGELDFNVDILDKELCHRYAGRIVKNLRLGASPEWLRNRLEKCNIRSINNIVDITNYVLLELGHPLHAFDLGTIKGRRIRIGTPNTVKGKGAKVVIKTIDGVDHEMPGESLLIWDEKRPIAVAGVMGGHETEVSDSTKDIFIESAYFDPASVRRTSKALGLKTESSFRFERGTDIKMLKKALDRAAYLMKTVAGGDIHGKIDIYPKRYRPAAIIVRYERVNEILGLRLTKKDMLNCLNGLGFEIETLPDRLKIKPPAYRRDIKMEADVIEEIVRIYGYDRIPAQLPKATIGTEGNELKVRSNIKQAFLKSGFTEVINYSFMGIHDIDMLGIDEKDERRNSVRIKNPLRAEDSLMRTTLIPSMIKNLVHNVAHGNKELRLFETAKVFIGRNENSGLPDEREHLAALYYKEKVKALYKDETHDFYIVKGIIEAVFNELKIYDYSFIRSSEPFLHSGQSADIFIMDEKVGYVGSVSPAVIDVLDIKAHKPAVVVMELDIDKLMPYTMQVVKYRALPKYPHVERDTALVVDSSIEASAIVAWLKSYASDMIEDIHIFDVYQGKNIPEGKKSIAFNVRYRAAGRTLKDEEVDALHKSLVDYILDKTNGQLRQ